jgi:Ca-activated chloride channel family protein
MNRKYQVHILMGIMFIGIFSAFTSAYTYSFSKKSFADTSAPTFINAKDHRGQSVVSTNGVVHFTTGLHNDYYQLDSPNKMGYFYIETRLTKFINDHPWRVPLNISIVIDRSGSMEGIKLGYAKKAAKGIIDQLMDKDLVSIVMYDNSVDTVQSPITVVNRDIIKAKIDRITPRGSTNLWGGTEQGYAYVQKNIKPGYINRVLLISDGLANVGITDSAVIRSRVQQYKDDNGISISTFGVGLDYNEALMTYMAESGAGNYYYIDAPDKMSSIFEKELNGMLNVGALNAQLKIKLPKGVTVQKGYPLKFSQKGDEITMLLRDLSSDETKAALFTFNIDKNSNSVLKFVSTLTYTDIIDGQVKTLSNENVLTPVKAADTYLTHFNKPVVKQTILFTANEKLEAAMNLMDRGDYNSARKFLDENRSYLKANDFYVKGDGELMQMDSLNTNYYSRSALFNSISADSAKAIKKTLRQSNYQLRTKKQ